MGKKNIVINGKPYQNVSNIKVRDVNGQDMHDFRNTDDATIESKDIPIGKVGYGKDGKVIGSYIPPSGEIDGGINFYDQYGAWLTSYSLEDLPLSALPEIPALEGAGADQYEFAWTMTLEEVNALTEEADIGVDVTAKEGAKTYLIPNELGFSGNNQRILLRGDGEASVALIDWGDGSSSTINIPATSYSSVQHTYTGASFSPIIIEKISGGYFLFGSAGNSASALTTGLSYVIKEIRFGKDVGISKFLQNTCEKVILNNSMRELVFSEWLRVKSLNIPKSCISLATINKCYCLENIFIHEGLQSSGNMVSYAPILKTLRLPKSYNTLTHKNIAAYCRNLRKLKTLNTQISVTATDGFSGVSNCSAFEQIDLSAFIAEISTDYMINCEGLKQHSIADGVKTISSECCEYCPSLQSITIPESIEEIGQNFLKQCYGIKQIIFKGTTPPIMGTNMLSGVNVKPKILVPKGSIEEYATATNLASWAESMVEY